MTLIQETIEALKTQYTHPFTDDDELIIKLKAIGGDTMNSCLWIIKKYLQEHGFDGLYDGDTCACGIENLVPCSEDFSYCLPGYRTETPGGEFDFEIGPVKAKETT